MSRGGRKGRIPNELVAASCAAILTVYAAGYWRTRDEARRLENEAHTRPVRPAPAPSAARASAPVAMPAIELQPAATEPLKAAAATAPAMAAHTQPVEPAAHSLVSDPVELESMPEAAADVADASESAAPVSAWRDGYYTGWGQSPHGDIEAKVTIKDGKIVDAGIVTCATRYPCYVIDTILNQPVVWQSPDVDRVSRATESADAYYWGLVQALKKAEVQPVAAATSP